MRSASPSDPNDCKEWCTNRHDCGGLSMWHDKCYFKNSACENNTIYVSQNEGSFLFLKQGSLNTFTLLIQLYDAKAAIVHWSHEPALIFEFSYIS